MAGLKKTFSDVITLFRDSAKKFGAENAPLNAAAISFFALITLLPVLLLAIAILGYILGSSEEAFRTVSGYFQRFVPTSTFVRDILRDLVQSRGTVGIIGILTFLWTGTSFFVILQKALDEMWEVGEQAGFIKARLKALLVLFIFGILMLLSLASSSIIGFLQAPGFWGMLSGAVTGLLSAIAILLGLAFAVAMFFVAYKMLPNRDIHWREALLGAVVAGVVWVIAKELYRLYVQNIADFGATYGSLGGVILLIIWIYYSSMIMLFGAELAYVHAYGPREEHEEASRM